MLVVAVMAVMAACSSKSGGGADAVAGASGSGGGGTGGGSTGGMDASPAACDPAAQNCTSALSKCDFVCQGNVAVLGCTGNFDGGALGSPCSAALPCAKGTGCLSADASVACRRYCAGDGDCATGERCHNVTVSVACPGGSSQIALHYCY